MAGSDKTIVEVQALDDFTGTLDDRLVEALAMLRGLTESLRRNPPALGALPDADYVRERYLTLYDEHVDRVNRLIHALDIAHGALATIADNYTTNEQRLAASAAEIGRLLDGVSGALNGGHSDGR